MSADAPLSSFGTDAKESFVRVEICKKENYMKTKTNIKSGNIMWGN